MSFRYFFDIIIIVNAIFIAFNLDGGEPFFLALFTLEITLKLYAFGLRAFVRKLWNLFDTIVVASALIVTIIEAALSNSHASQVALDFLLVLRVVRIFRIFHSVVRFRLVINAILHILPSMVTYMGVLFVFYYFFAILGMELFGGKITYYGYAENTDQKYCGNIQLQGSQFFQDHYCSNNFNDLLSSFVTLFELMAVNQWHVLTKGHVLVTTKAARLYFFSFHFLCVTLILNIFSAFVIEAFILEYSVTSDKGQQPLSSLQQRIAAIGLAYGKTEKANVAEDKEELLDEDFMDADHKLQEIPEESNSELPNFSHQTGMRFRLTSRTRSVMGLLEKMFENDLNEGNKTTSIS